MPPEAPDAWADVIHPVGMSRFEPIYVPPPLRQPHRRRAGTFLRALLLIVAPTLATGAYFGLVAADRYVSEAKFVIHKPENPSRGPAQSLSIEDGPKGFGGDNSYAVRDYIMSRDALALLLEKAAFRDVVAKGGDDWLWRFPGPLTGRTDEDLYRLYQSLVTVDYDSSTGVTALRVEAFRPAEAQQIATTLIEGGEALLARMSQRSRADAIRLAQEEVARARKLASDAQERVTAFRNRESVIDPTQISKTVQATMTSLSLELVETRAQMEVTSQASPRSPQLALYRARIAALQQQIAQERGTLAGSDRSLAPRIAEYERLVLQRSFAEKSFVSALSQLEAAQVDSRRQQDYLEPVVSPHAADEARYPFRILWTLSAFLGGLAVFWMFRPQGPGRA